MRDTRNLTQPPAWHVAEEADERAWLDNWARLHPIPAPDTVPALERQALTYRTAA